MKTLLTLAALAFVSLFGLPQAAHAEETKPTIVAFHSDTCGKCKILGPKLMDALNSVEDESVNFVKFDYTNRDTIDASKELATEKGLVDLQKKYGAKTGFAVLVNADGTEGPMIKSSLSEDEIETLLKQAANS